MFKEKQKLPNFAEFNFVVLGVSREIQFSSLWMNLFQYATKTFWNVTFLLKTICGISLNRKIHNSFSLNREIKFLPNISSLKGTAKRNNMITLRPVSSQPHARWDSL